MSKCQDVKSEDNGYCDWFEIVYKGSLVIVGDNLKQVTNEMIWWFIGG